jgi:hypothetical protein
MDHAEEQAMEVEMLQAMFMEDFKPEVEAGEGFHIDLFPESSADGDSNHVAAELHVTYTARYPEEPPVLAVAPKLGLAEGLAREAAAMLAEAASSELLGAPMVWALAEKLQAWLREHNTAPVGNMYDEMMKRTAAASGEGDDGGSTADEGDGEDGDTAANDGSTPRKPVVEVDERQQHGSYTPVTVENFNEWRVAFEARRRGGAAAAELSTKLSGRQLFESGRTVSEGGSVGVRDDDDVEDADYTRRESDDDGGGSGGDAAATSRMAIDESLFDDEEDDD